MKNVCKICGSKDIEILFNDAEDFEYDVNGKFKFCRCNNCSLIFLEPIPTIKELISYYPSYYHGYEQKESKITKSLIQFDYKNKEKKIRSLIGNTGKILDIGCADGKNFIELNKRGNWDFYGIEFNDEIAERGRKNGLKIRTGVLETCKFNHKFDLIIMNHLIEHVIDPIQTMKLSKNLLKKGGYILGETPNTSCIDFKIFKKYWGGLHTPRHTFLFDTKSLKLLLNKAGFKEHKINLKLHTGHFALSIQNSLQDIYKIKLKNGRSFYYPFLLISLIPINILQMIFKYSGVMSFIAKK